MISLLVISRIIFYRKHFWPPCSLFLDGGSIDLYKDIRSWFIENNKHPSFKGQDLPNDITSIQPTLIQDEECATDESEDKTETSFGGATLCFSSAQDPSTDTSVFETARKFACALVNRTIPKLLISGDTSVRDKEIDIEAILPFAFPYGLGGPKAERRKHVPFDKHAFVTT